jgi:hypothetical protein
MRQKQVLNYFQLHHQLTHSGFNHTRPKEQVCYRRNLAISYVDQYLPFKLVLRRIGGSNDLKIISVAMKEVVFLK